jgi:uncharacterized LabA/DUF88 family protein
LGLFLFFQGAAQVTTYAVFVDAGYLKNSAARALSKPVHKVKLNAEAVVLWARGLAGQHELGNSLLRVYWYDGTFDPSHAEYPRHQRYIDRLWDVPGIQLRLGHVVERQPAWHNAIKYALKACGVSLAEFKKHFTFRPQREQKGVDALLALDLVRMAQKRTFDCAVIVAGDRDFEEAVRAAQDEGRRIVIAVPTDKGLSIQLRRGADEVLMIDPTALSTFFDPIRGRSMSIAS